VRITKGFKPCSLGEDGIGEDTLEVFVVSCNGEEGADVEGEGELSVTADALVSDDFLMGCVADNLETPMDCLGRLPFRGANVLRF
jgi:hypothetical protein